MKWKQWFKPLFSKTYTIGFVKNPIEDVVTGKSLEIQLVKHNFNDRWFADPFILDVTPDTIYVLVEEMMYGGDKADIALLGISRESLTVSSRDIILSLNTHLSFPVIRRSNESVFIYPENGTSGRLREYELRYKDRFIGEGKDLYKGNIADAVRTNLFGDDMMFGTLPPHINSDLLSVFKWDGTEYLPFQNVSFHGDKVGRMAGDFFEYNGKVYRPAQDCNSSYGHGIVIQEVNRSDAGFQFTEVARYDSPSARYSEGFHTLNIYKGFIVADFLGYKYMPRLTKSLLKVYYSLK